MNYDDAFLTLLRRPSWASYPVTVTGPQRAGTRIATAILARDLGRRFVGEEHYDVSQHDGLLRRYLAFTNEGAAVVIHAPELSSIAHHLPGIVVFMRRDPADIIRSQDRINWVYEQHELVRYFTDQGPIAEVTYRSWDLYQKPLLKERALDLEYVSLRGHDLWVPREQRKAFHPHQITPKDRPISAIQYRSSVG